MALEGLSGLGGLSGVMGMMDYTDKVMNYNPIAYWPLFESTGTVAESLVDVAQNGIYSRDVSVMGTGDGIGDGNTAPVFDGVNDYINIDTAALEAVLDGDEGCLALWMKPNNALQWTDTNERRTLKLFGNVGTDDQFYLSALGNGNVRFVRRGGGTDRADEIAISGAGWVFFLGRWSRTGNEVQIFKNGIGSGSPAICDVNWSSASLASALIGAWNLGSLMWLGQLAHIILFDNVLTNDDIIDLATLS